MSGSSAGRKRPRTPRPSSRGMRSCIGCRERHPREALVRVVRAPDGQVLVDRYLRAPGRGAHLCYSRDCVEKAVRRKAFGRAFEAPVEAIEPEALAGEILAAVRARILEGLAIGRRAGRTVSGMEALSREAARLALLVVATDAAEGSVERLERLAANAGCPLYRLGTADELGTTQGREARIAIGVTDRRQATRLVAEFERRDRVLVAAVGQSR